jgi:hypothetical protein
VSVSSSSRIEPGVAPAQPHREIEIVIVPGTRLQSNSLVSSAARTCCRAASLPPSKT